MKIVDIALFVQNHPPKQPKKGKVLCDSCKGYGVVATHHNEGTDNEYWAVAQCHSCGGHGSYEPCPYCGGACKVTARQYKCTQAQRDYDEMFAKHAEERAQTRWQHDVELCGIQDYDYDSVVYSDGLDKYIDDPETIVEAWLEANNLSRDQIKDAPPIDPAWLRLYATKSLSLRLPNAADLVEAAINDVVDPDYDVTPPQKAINKLDHVLRSWEQQYLTEVGITVDETKPLRPPHIEDFIED